MKYKLNVFRAVLLAKGSKLLSACFPVMPGQVENPSVEPRSTTAATTTTGAAATVY